MNQWVAIMIAGIEMLYMVEGIADAITKNKSRMKNIIDIGYPAFVFVGMLYLLGTGSIK